MNWWSKVFGKERPDLVALALDRLPREWPELRFSRRDEGTLDVALAATGEPLLVVSLATLLTRADEGDGAVDSWLADPQIRRGFDVAAGRIEVPPFDAAGLVPRFSAESRLSGLEDPPAHREAWPRVWLTVCWHHADSQTDELIAAPTTPRARADGHFRTARESFAESAHPVSDRVLVVTGEGFAPEERR